MDYCVRESTVNSDELCERKMSANEMIRDIRKELAETISCLSSIKLSLCGEQCADRKQEEPKCMNDELKLIEHMTMDCVALSHNINDVLFFVEGR